MIALPDHVYVWKNGALVDERLPDYQAPTSQPLQDYWRALSPTDERISEHGLELTLAAWLSDLAHSDLTSLKARPILQWFLDSGLYDSIREGSVRVEQAA